MVGSLLGIFPGGGTRKFPVVGGTPPHHLTNTHTHTHTHTHTYTHTHTHAHTQKLFRNELIASFMSSFLTVKF